ncbi:hypothetical protein EZV62_003546 [Acer yangbiense]|uniref:PGG domain-containing protein n=1 Tax=Acer yangbiense TaxID=1000413 RepID=A0A5C7IHL6_9ROSI|nr:hypothetical protein EZV62_003546 [Acer yangbiense]
MIMMILDHHDHRTAERLNYYRPLYNAAISGDWKAAICFIEHDPNALTAKITALTERTVFHVAAICWQWEFVLKLLELITSPQSIVVQDQDGLTVMHYVSIGGSLKTAKALVQKNSDLLQIGNNYGDLPLVYSIWSRNKELMWYLSLITRVDSPIWSALILSGHHVVHVEIRNAQTHLVMVNMEDIPESILEGFPTLQPRSFATQDLIDVPLMPEGNILQAAIKHRQVKIVNIIKEIFPTATKSMCAELMKSDQSTTLHLAGELAPQIKLLSVSGAALQMQRELQWFKEVKEIEFPILWDVKNENGETTKDVFRRAHKELAKEGEKWMKDTANSCMLVSALIATVLFAAAFTVPGGNTNDDKGIPIFLRTNAFTIFAISYALGLFSSLTSLLMFLAIITARYEVEDFLESLPKKLIIGLGSLFVSIAAMIIAFGAALTIALNERWNWVFVPITLLASFPVAIFVMLQLPLFVQMVRSTYGASIFRPWPSRKFE